MGYHVMLYESPEAAARGEYVCVAYCSAFTPSRQQQMYRYDFLDLVTSDVDGVPHLGDAGESWVPDWDLTKLDLLERDIYEAGVEYDLLRVDEWRILVLTGWSTPGSVVMMSA